MITSGLRLGLTKDEIEGVRKALGREPNETEWAVIDAEWSEHSSYKSSKKLLRLFPTSGKRVVLGPGYDAGVVDVGDGYVVTLHIESHNHPSAVDPYGGSSTGIGGVLRDILSMGTRPIALLDILRFGDVEKSSHSRWLLRNVVRGIADYGNCVGVPTVAGDIEFDPTYERNCLVDVACVGTGRKEGLILGEADTPGDLLLLIGGSTGRDGLGGAAFASRNLASEASSDRSSVQVPDPFTKKLLIESLLEAAALGLIRGMKDLGGGGLSTALSEMPSKGGTGVDVELSTVRVRDPEMGPTEIFVSESQERMLLALDPAKLSRVIQILDKYGVSHTTIGRVTADGRMRARWHGKTVLDLPVALVASAPLASWSAIPPHADSRVSQPILHEPPPAKSLDRLLRSPAIASRRWVFEQYDHEVGISTVLKPGMADSALLRLPNGKGLAVKADGNSKHSSLDPRRGAAGCVAEACRNVVTVGAEPIAMVDHLQFGDPSDPEVYWAFSESVGGMSEYCRGAGLPVVGGKVSFYNEDEATGLPIKPAPVAMVVGLARTASSSIRSGYREAGESVFLIGSTHPEMGGSEYFETVLGVRRGVVPLADPSSDLRTFRTVIRLVSDGLVGSVHDCSKGGLAVALAEMSMPSRMGARLDLAALLSGPPTQSEALFSESHGRFLLATTHRDEVSSVLASTGLPHFELGTTGGDSIDIRRGPKTVAKLDVDRTADSWGRTFSRLFD
jgi:phosphoribosylformylglycinamidine synthase